MTFLQHLYEVFAEMSLYLMLGLALVGLLGAFELRDFVKKQLGKPGIASVVKASVLGVPLPLCSCGVLPMAVELKNAEASPGSVLSFLISTPQTGVDSLVATWGMLGPFVAVYRAFAAFCSGVIGGLLANVFTKGHSLPATDSGSSNLHACGCGTATAVSACGCDAPAPVSACSCDAPAPTSACGCDAPTPTSACGCAAPAPTSACGCAAPAPVSACGCAAPAPVSSCCSGNSKPVAHSFFGRLKQSMHYAFFTFLEEIAPPLFVGILASAAISTLVPEDFFLRYGLADGLPAMLLMLVIGLPLYICSTASLPIALSLVLKGLSPGAAFVFLFAGPVSNFASLAVLRKTLGTKLTAIYVGTVMVLAVVFGLLFDVLAAKWQLFSALTLPALHEHHSPSVFALICAAIFLILLVRALIASLHKRYRPAEIGQHSAA